jgi:hypothetical protein
MRFPFTDGTFDGVVCQLGLQFFSDPLRGLDESRGVRRATPTSPKPARNVASSSRLRHYSGMFPERVPISNGVEYPT